MSALTHAQRILSLLAQAGGLDDDEIARELAISPRQTVNQICNRLAVQGLLTRGRADSGKIVNRLREGATLPPRGESLQTERPPNCSAPRRQASGSRFRIPRAR
jgi:hypothetical protein